MELRRTFVLLLGSWGLLMARAQAVSVPDSALTKRIEHSPRLQLQERQLALHALPLGWAMGAVSGVAVGRDGNVYVIQRGTNADPILVFDSRGRFLRSWGRGDFLLPHSLRVDPRGNVWALDADASKVTEYTSKGAKLLTLSIQPVPETGSPFRGVTDIAFALNGNILLTDGYGNGRVLEYTAKGREVREWGTPGSGPGQFHLPHAIQVSRSGTVYVADRENGRIELFDRRGAFLRSFEGLGRCYSLALRDRALWVTTGPLEQDPGAPGWLLKLDAERGRILGQLAVPEPRSGHALALSQSGAVLETAGSGLLLFAADASQ